MEGRANQLIEETQEAHGNVPSFSLELLREKLEYLDVKADFFENQTVLINEIIHKAELKNLELFQEEQELTEKFKEGTEVKKNLVNILNGFKNQRVKTHKKDDITLMRINGFYYCPECPYQTKWDRSNLKLHINAVHRKLKPWKCSDCTKGKLFNAFKLNFFIK